jgi:hypothetical protein
MRAPCQSSGRDYPYDFAGKNILQRASPSVGAESKLPLPADFAGPFTFD